MQFLNKDSEFDYWNECVTDCNSKEIHCDNKCRARISVLRFNTSTEKLMYYYSCGIKCRIDVEEARGKTICDGNFVDCSFFGGYDPVD